MLQILRRVGSCPEADQFHFCEPLEPSSHRFAVPNPRHTCDSKQDKVHEPCFVPDILKEMNEENKGEGGPKDEGQCKRGLVRVQLLGLGRIRCERAGQPKSIGRTGGISNTYR